MTSQRDVPIFAPLACGHPFPMRGAHANGVFHAPCARHRKPQNPTFIGKSHLAERVLKNTRHRNHTHAMNATFEDLRITGLIEERCELTSGTVTRIYLQLSEPPPLGWSYLFNTAWDSAVHPVPRKVGVDGDAIWIECGPSELLVHLPHVEAAMQYANATHAAALRRRLAAEQAHREREAEARAQLAALADYLNPTGNPRQCHRHEDDSTDHNHAITGMLQTLWRNCRTLLTGRCD